MREMDSYRDLIQAVRRTVLKLMKVSLSCRAFGAASLDKEFTDPGARHGLLSDGCISLQGQADGR